MRDEPKFSRERLLEMKAQQEVEAGLVRDASLNTYRAINYHARDCLVLIEKELRLWDRCDKCGHHRFDHQMRHPFAETPT